jgi:hypothetical protein
MGSSDSEGGRRTCNSSWYLHRERKIPQRYSCYSATMSHIIDSEPSCYEEASSQPVWKDAMMEEYQSIMKNDVWDIVRRLEGKFVVTSKWIYKIKHIADGSIEKHKARFVAREFSQVDGIDYDLRHLILLLDALLYGRLFPLQHPWAEDYIRWM